MTTTADNITDEQIRTLRAKALRTGDDETVTICDWVLTRVPLRMRLGRSECARIIAAEEASP